MFRELNGCISQAKCEKDEFMRVRSDLRAFSGIYVRSWRFMRAQRNLRAFREIYARSANIEYLPAELILI